MGLRDRLQERTLRAGAEVLRKTATSVPVKMAEDGFRGFREMLAGRDEALSAEFFLLSLVRAVRSDELDEDRSRRDVYVLARKRRRRLALVAVAFGPAAGLANQVADLYCEAAIVCDLADFRKKDLSDDQVAAHMLVLWKLADDFEAARRAVAGDPPVVRLLGGRLSERFDGRQPDKLTKAEIVGALWGVRGDVKGVRGGGMTDAVQTVALTGFRTKGLIERIEAQLGIERGQ
jgi:hypothetical protein